MSELTQIIEKLKSNDNVDCVFLTGSHGKKENKPHSDIDLVIILKKNDKDIKSVYTFIDETFADIFFFDLADIEYIKQQDDINPRADFGAFVSWLLKADVQFDKSGTVTNLIKTLATDIALKISYADKYNQWQVINYNYVANQRYFWSNDPIYHEALEIRLLYCMSSLICDYLLLRGVPWRGEKNAVFWLKENALEYYELFRKYTRTSNLEDRFNLYSQMVQKVFPSEYKLWDKSVIVALPKRVFSENVLTNLVDYWKGLIGYSHVYVSLL